MLLIVSEGDFCPVDIGLQLTYNILYCLCHCFEDWLDDTKGVEYVTVFTVVIIGVKEGSEAFVLLKSTVHDAAFFDGVGAVVGRDIINDVSHFYIAIVHYNHE